MHEETYFNKRLWSIWQILAQQLDQLKSSSIKNRGTENKHICAYIGQIEALFALENSAANPPAGQFLFK